jgi:hypothetical protein
MNKHEKSKEQRLIEDGWERQFTASEPRLSEARELYESLGYEVRLEPADTSCHDAECRVCLDAEKDKTIYTRKKRNRKLK